MIGTTLSHYRITEKLGAGGIGIVYRAEDTSLNRQVAIKVLPDIFSGDPERLARFEREAKERSSNCVQPYDHQEIKMKTLLVLITIIVVTCFVVSCSSNEPTPAAAPSAAPSGGEENVEQVLAKLSDEWGRISLSKDISLLERILAPDFSYVEADGSVFNKQEGIAAVSKDTDVVTNAVVSNFKVRVYGKDFAVTFGDHAVEGRDKDGKEFRRKGRFTNVWVKQSGAWQCVAGHSSDLK